MQQGDFLCRRPDKASKMMRPGASKGEEHGDDRRDRFGFGLGVLLGYQWRELISQRRRAQFRAERVRDEREAIERERQAKASSSISIDGVSRMKKKKS